MGSFLQLLPQGGITFLDNVLRKIHILEIVQSIQTEWPVVVSEQVVEVCCMLNVSHFHRKKYRQLSGIYQFFTLSAELRAFYLNNESA